MVNVLILVGSGALLLLPSENLPNKLSEVAWDRVPSHFPIQYQRNAIASTLASKLVYQEGIHLVETQPVEVVATRAFEYYRVNNAITKLSLELASKEWVGVTQEDKDKTLDLLRRGGARTTLEIF